MENGHAEEPLVTSRARSGRGPSPTCGLRLLPHKPKVRARVGLVLGLSQQDRSQSKEQFYYICPQARKSPTRARTFQARPGPNDVTTSSRCLLCTLVAYLRLNAASGQGCQMVFSIEILELQVCWHRSCRYFWGKNAL
jgi:hypothetical protein